MGPIQTRTWMLHLEPPLLRPRSEAGKSASWCSSYLGASRANAFVLALNATISRGLSTTSSVTAIGSSLWRTFSKENLKVTLLTRGLEEAQRVPFCFLCPSDLPEIAELRLLSFQSQAATWPRFLLQQAENWKWASEAFLWQRNLLPRLISVYQTVIRAAFWRCRELYAAILPWCHTAILPCCFIFIK